MNLPNKLTILRVCLIPFFVLFLLVDIGGGYGDYIALGIFCIASFTDFLDGYLARKYHLITNFGKFMDPLADKLLVCAAMICLLALGRLGPVVVILIMSREFIISGFRLVAADQGVVIAAGYWGKGKTVCQMAMIILLLIHWEHEVFRVVEQVSVWAAVALTVISLGDYLVKNRSVLRGAKPETH